MNQADVHDLVDPETLRRSLDAYVGMPGAKTLRTMLDRHTFRLSDSDLEIYFRPLALAAGFPLPLSKQWVLGYEVDFHFPDHGLIVETDGLRYHRTPAQQARMVKRDQTHTSHGFRVLRFTHWQIAHAPNEVADVLGPGPEAGLDAGGLRFAEAVAAGGVGAGRPVHPLHDVLGIGDAVEDEVVVAAARRGVEVDVADLHDPLVDRLAVVDVLDPLQPRLLDLPRDDPAFDVEAARGDRVGRRPAFEEADQRRSARGPRGRR